MAINDIIFATADMLGAKLIRVQFYEGLTADKILYDYDYQRQLLTIESIKSVLSKELSDKNIEKAIDATKDIDFFANGVASCLVSIQSLNLKQMPSIDEGIKWAKYLKENFGEITEDNIDYTICMLAKNKEDLSAIVRSGVARKVIE